MIFTPYSPRLDEKVTFVKDGEYHWGVVVGYASYLKDGEMTTKIRVREFNGTDNLLTVEELWA